LDSLPERNLALKLKNEQSKENLVNRLRRIEGQVRGVQNMVAEERDCREIMQQLAAVRSAVQSVTGVFISEYATKCLLEENSDPASKEELIENLVALFAKAP
jgi:CsoR family transcriptional regulator, copper-sensing transcriptional repressor